jgi:hypothetical protein
MRSFGHEWVIGSRVVTCSCAPTCNLAVIGRWVAVSCAESAQRSTCVGRWNYYSPVLHVYCSTWTCTLYAMMRTWDDVANRNKYTSWCGLIRWWLVGSAHGRVYTDVATLKTLLATDAPAGDTQYTYVQRVVYIALPQRATLGRSSMIQEDLVWWAFYVDKAHAWYLLRTVVYCTGTRDEWLSSLFIT